MIKAFISLVKSWLKPEPEWHDGEPPSHIPRSYITQGMRLDPNNPRGVISTWKFNAAYYQSLL